MLAHLSVATVFVFALSQPAFANELHVAVQNARQACGGISEITKKMKTKAGINTAVTAAGTIASGVALGTGIAKSKTDDLLSEETEKILAKYANNRQDPINIKDWSAFERELDEMVASVKTQTSQEDSDRIEELKKESDRLGKIRTGTLATSTAANIAGTIVASTNTTDKDLAPMVANCITSIKNLSNAYMSAKVAETANSAELDIADKIVKACRDWEQVDLKPIDNRAKGAAISSGVAAGTGLIGTIASGVAQSNQKQGLDKTANVMAAATSLSGATATVFNATQIATIKKAADVADKCEEALR